MKTELNEQEVAMMEVIKNKWIETVLIIFMSGCIRLTS